MPHWLFASLRGYRLGWLPRDLVAGLMLAAIAIPGQLATARLAGMLPETGLLFGGGEFYYGPPDHYSGGGLGLVLLIVIIVLLFRRRA